MVPSSIYRVVAEAECRVPGLELRRGLEEADILPSLAYAGDPYQVFGERSGALALIERMEPLGHGAIRCRHLGDLREHIAFAVRLLSAAACFGLCSEPAPSLRPFPRPRRGRCSW